MSEDESLLRDLGKLVREMERTAGAARLEQLCRGELGEEQRLALEEVALDPERGRAVRAFTPFSEDVKARFAQCALGAVLAGGQGASAERFGSGIRRRLEVPRWSWLAALLVPVAGVVLYFASASHERPPVLSYRMELSGQAAELRSTAPAVAQEAVAAARLVADTRLQIVLRPDAKLEGTPSAFVFVVLGEQALPWPAEVATAPSGAIRVALEPLPTPLRTGKRAQVVVSLPAVGPSDAARLALGDASRGPGFQRFAIDLLALDGP